MFFKILVQCYLIQSIYAISKHPILIVVSYDGFRYDFINKTTTPYLEQIRRQGTYADYMMNVFPTKTFPNHHSIATGVYTETHGVIGNRIYDPVTDTIMKASYDMFHYNEEIRPIWRINEDAGEGRHSGVMMWPGGIYAYQGKNISHSQQWDKQYDFHKRIDTVMSWINDPEKPANFIMLYFEEPDSDLHIYGPNAEQVMSVIQKMDNITQYLWDQLKEQGIADKVNVIHLSDHGVSEVTPPRMINLTEYLTPDTYIQAGTTPCLHYIPKEGHEENVYRELKKAALEIGHFTVFKKEELPDFWHFKNNERTPPIFVLADEKYGFQDMLRNVDYYAEKWGIKVTSASEFGQHGYDNRLIDMRPFFLARGPKIRRNHKVLPFDTVDLLSLFCEILEIETPQNNGSYSNIADILTSAGHHSILSTIFLIVAGILLTVALISFAAIITLLLIKRQQKLTTVAALNKRFPQNFHHSSIEVQHLLEPEDA